MDYINYVKQSPMSMGGMGGVVGSYNFRSAGGIKACDSGQTGAWYGDTAVWGGGYANTNELSYVQIPTTLASMVDASIGGKVGVNLTEGKNLIGSFYHPKLVFQDLSFLLSNIHSSIFYLLLINLYISGNVIVNLNHRILQNNLLSFLLRCVTSIFQGLFL